MTTRARLGALGLAVALAGEAVACITHGAPPAYPLYPGPRAAPDQVALLLGAIATVDRQDVSANVSTFELLPRCHVVTTQTKLLAYDPSTTTNAQGEVTGTLPPMTYAIDMKAGHTYVIERQVQAIGGNSANVVVTARDVAGDGQSIDLAPTRSGEEIAACMTAHP